MTKDTIRARTHRQEPRGVGGPNCFECTIAVDDLEAEPAGQAAQAQLDRLPRRVRLVGVLHQIQHRLLELGGVEVADPVGRWRLGFDGL